MHARYVRGFPFHSTPGYSRAVPAGTQKIRTFDFLPSWIAVRKSAFVQPCHNLPSLLSPQSVTLEQAFLVRIEFHLLADEDKELRSSGNICTPAPTSAWKSEV